MGFKVQSVDDVSASGKQCFGGKPSKEDKETESDEQPPSPE
jgi:hypothetical protein